MHWFAAVDDFDGAADGAHVFRAGLHAQAFAEGLEEIVHGDGAVFDFDAVSVGFADNLATANAATGQSHVEGLGIMVAAGVGVDGGCAAEFAHPDDERFIEHAALLEIGNQSCERFVDGFGQLGGAAEIVLVGIPPVEYDFDKGDAGFNETTGEQAAGTEVRFAIGRTHTVGFFRQVESFHVGTGNHFHRALVELLMLGRFVGELAVAGRGFELIEQVEPIFVAG